MRIWIFSDLHIDANGDDPIGAPSTRPPHDLILIAGDICDDMVRGLRWIIERQLNEKPVVYVAGNHEFYGSDRHRMLACAMTEARRAHNIHILQDQSLQLDGVTVWGATFWTDYCLFGKDRSRSAMSLAGQSLNDHRRIRLDGRLWRPEDAACEHERSRESLHQTLEHRRGPVVVVTHHAPSLRSVHARFRRGALSPAFASNCDTLLDRASAWVHGHTHDPFDYAHGRCRVICNPRGYVGDGEGRHFDPFKVIEVTSHREVAPDLFGAAGHSFDHVASRIPGRIRIADDVA